MPLSSLPKRFRPTAGVDSLKWIGFLFGPAMFMLILWQLHPASMNPGAVKVMAATLWIATWWITEAVPLPITSLLPIVLFPLLGVMPVEDTTKAYGHPLVFLYIGGFLLAIGIEKTGLHSRIALRIIQRMGTRLSSIVLGFMLATGFLSMWISNTATTIMMLPIGLALINVIMDEQDERYARFSKGLMLAIAYSASIGGMATLIGTPPNIVFAGLVKNMFNHEVTFAHWFTIAFPLSFVLLIFTWWYLTSLAFPLKDHRITRGKEELALQASGLGKMSASEKKVAVVFFLVAFAWITRSFLWSRWIPGLDDTIIGIAGGLVLFIIPEKTISRRGVLTWEDAIGLPWGIILLFGGGLALAAAFETSGLSKWIGESLTGLIALGTFLLLLMVVTVVNFLTEFTSNLATATMILPVLAPMAIASGMDPVILMAAATLAASCGYMMPAATPPNAIVFGSGHLHIREMIRTGLVLNFVSILLITLMMYFFRM